jgi:rhamnogalacturonan endolyase
VRYNNVWAYTAELAPLWHWSGDTGHFPCPADVDGDGRDEVLVGDSLLGPDGGLRWRRPLRDHADNALLGPYGPGGRPVAIVAAGDAGIVWYDLEGQVLARDNTGHTQGVTLARLRPELPDWQCVTTTFWREPGIVTLYDAAGRRLAQYQPNHLASHLQPVNWRGDGSELLLLSADPEEGGGIDGRGRRALVLPRDGHPTLCAEALDLTGDPRDEIVVWDRERLWIYTQDERPAPGGPDGRMYVPRRLPLWNTSNYRAQVSLPAWQACGVRGARS